MRSISLVQKIEYDYKGSVFQNAACLLDIDNDGHNELCVCNINGDLHVYKGKVQWNCSLEMQSLFCTNRATITKYSVHIYIAILTKYSVGIYLYNKV